MLRHLIRELRRRWSGANAAAPPGGVENLLASGEQRFLAADYDGAEAALREALKAAPDSADALHALGVLAQIRGDARRAIELYTAALAIKPGVASWLSNCGEAYRVLGRSDLAIRYCTQAVALAPEHADARLNLGVALLAAGRYAEAADAAAAAVRLRPDDPSAHIAMATLHLLLGDYERGWPEYAWRRKLPSYRASAPSLEQPAWDGAMRPDATLLVYAEQGYGDSIQFARYVRLAAERCARVVLKVYPELESLLTSVCGPRIELVRNGTRVPRFDAHASLVDLAALLGTATPADIPSNTPYLAAPAERTAAWRRTLEGEGRLRVGLTWAGNRQHLNDANRSCTLDAFAALARVEGAVFYALQKEGDSARDWPGGGRSPLADIGPLGDFGDTAGLIENLDLVITVDTSVAHLAGALGKPVWTVLPHAPDWRWLTERSDTPWYPTMRLFRQRAAGDWGGVFDEVRAALESARSQLVGAR